MTESIRALLAEFVRTEMFELVAEATLKAMLERAEESLGGGHFSGRGHLLRGMVHLRPDGGYRGLLVLDLPRQGAPITSFAPPDGAMLPSLTVWRWVESRQVPLAVDVQLATATPLLGASVPVVLSNLEGPEEPDAPFASRARLLDRETTHLLAIPLRLSTTEVAGMISLEATCPAATGQAFIWQDCVEDLQLLCDLATPYLLSRPLRRSRGPAQTGDPLLPVVGPSMEGMVNLLRVFARQEETVLITGPTGSGKSRLARFCHAQSSRHDKAFETVDLQTVPREMQMAELFGWRRGAFTGAVGDHPGCIGLADGGTLFLDEIGVLSLDAQAGLLQLLEERRYRVLGDKTGMRKADVRFIIGTNADLRAAVREGRFREDLYYRINVLPVELPSLRERRDELLLWAAYMLERRHREGNTGGEARLSADAGLQLAAFAWPGNLRQLDNVIRRAYAMALSEWTDVTASIEIQQRHIQRALSFEREGEQEGLLEVLRQAARAYAIEAERRQGKGTSLGLSLADAFTGLVLSAGVALTGSRPAAFRLYALSHMVESRNHHKAFERAANKVLAALNEMGERPDAELLSQLK